MKRIFIYSFLWLCFLIALGGCQNNKTHWSEFYNFGSNGMGKETEYVYYPFGDSITLKDNNIYSIDIVARYSQECQLTNLPLKIEYASLINDSIKQSQLLLPLFDKENKIVGRGNFNVYESSVNFLKNLNSEDGFFMSISTIEESTKGILSLGIVCYKTN